jgi:hypothetical protein
MIRNYSLFDLACFSEQERESSSAIQRQPLPALSEKAAELREQDLDVQLPIVQQ